MQGVLNAGGVTSFSQLAGTALEDLQAWLDAADYQYMDPASWPEQAKLAAESEWEALEKFQDELKGDR